MTATSFHRFRATRTEVLVALTTKPVDIASLAMFRILFGLLMCAAMIRFMAKGWIRELYLEPAFHFGYPGFEWVQPWPGSLMYVHFIALAVFALCMAAGLFYRWCATLFFLGFTYVELLDQTAYLNHYYLVSLLSGLLILVPAHRAWSVDALRKPGLRAAVAPASCLNILRFQVAVVYVYAGLAKVNADWLLHAQPLRIWLAARSDLAVIGPWLAQPWVAFAASWFGAIFDTTIVFFLLRNRTRKFAYVALILFHLGTWLFFNIGMFPWIMVVSATVLFPPDWPRFWVDRLKKRSFVRLPCLRWLGATGETSRNGLRMSYGRNDFSPMPHPLSLLLVGFIVVQVILPLRSYFCTQPTAWTCSGFNCAWRVMIAEKTGYAEFYAFDAGTGFRERLNLRKFITPRQEMMMAQDPYLIREMARYLSKIVKPRDSSLIEIRVEAFATLNGRPSQRLINPQTNLAGDTGQNWITPLEPKMERRSFPAIVASW